MNDNPSTTLSGSPSTAVSLQYFSRPETLREDFPFTYPDITVFPWAPLEEAACTPVRLDSSAGNDLSDQYYAPAEDTREKLIKAMQTVFGGLLRNQEPLGAEFSKVLEDNIYDLIEE